MIATGRLAKPGRYVRHKARLNREILPPGRDLLALRLQDKAPARWNPPPPAGEDAN